MKFTSKCSLVFLGAIVTASAAFAQGKAKAFERQAGPSHEVEDIRLRHNRQIAPYVPSDIKEVPGQVGVHTCNERGEYAHDPISGCFNYSSASTNTSWRIRYGQAGAAIAIFKLRNGQPTPHVSFASDNSVTYASPEAKKFAQANGVADTQVVKGTVNSNPTQTGARQQETPPQPSQRVNCKELSLLERVACEAAANVFKGK